MNIDSIIELALLEDLGDGDHTSLAAIPTGTLGKARLLVKEDGVLAGVNVARKVFEKLDPSLQMKIIIEDGTVVKKGDIAFIVQGSSISVLSAERTVLNFMQRLSGIATNTHKLSQMISHTNTRLLDTRKTTPGMRELEKYAVRMGGGINHRMGLWDMIMIKDNHVDFAGGVINAIMAVKDYLTVNNKILDIEVEVRNIEELKQVLEVGGVKRVMLDNFTPEKLKEAVAFIDGRLETEASGGINELNLLEYAESGVNFISVGSLTHHVKSLDLSLKAF